MPHNKSSSRYCTIYNNVASVKDPLLVKTRNTKLRVCPSFRFSRAAVTLLCKNKFWKAMTDPCTKLADLCVFGFYATDAIPAYLKHYNLEEVWEWKLHCKLQDNDEGILFNSTYDENGIHSWEIILIIARNARFILQLQEIFHQLPAEACSVFCAKRQFHCQKRCRPFQTLLPSLLQRIKLTDCT